MLNGVKISYLIKYVSDDTSYVITFGFASKLCSFLALNI